MGPVLTSQFLHKQFNSQHPNWQLPTSADEMIKSIDTIEAFLPNFIEISEAELPTDTRENLKVGVKFDRD